MLTIISFLKDKNKKIVWFDFNTQKGLFLSFLSIFVEYTSQFERDISV